MTDIYVRKPPTGRGKWIAIGIGSIGLIFLLIVQFAKPGNDASVDITPSMDEDYEADSETEEVPPSTPPRPDEGPTNELQTPIDQSSSAAQLLARTRTLQEGGNLLAARDTAYRIMEIAKDERMLDSARSMLSDINTLLTTTPRQMPEKIDYTIRSGDTLGKIAKDHDTTIELIQKSNNLTGSLIRVGDRLRILKGQFSMKVDKSDNILDLYLDGRFFKRYLIGTGAYAKTPEGEFLVNDRIAQPTWWRPDGKAVRYGDPENLLGTHWLSLNIRGYGIHGTWEPETIGQHASAGCVRLLNEDIEELFAFTTLGTPVSITE